MFVPCKCPQCSGDLQIPDDRDIVKCMYCGTDIKVREVISISIGNADNLKNLGISAFDAGDYREATEYLNKFLEINSTDVNAWMFKGLSSGWQSTLGSDNFDQMISFIDKGISLCKNEAEENVYKMTVAPHMLLLAKSYEAMSRDHTVEFISVVSAIYDHIDRCKRIILMLEKAYYYDGEFVEIKDYIARLASHEMKNHRASSDEKNFFKQKYIQYNRIGASAVTLSKQEKSNCFVVTATLGNEENLFVNSLRTFRDKILIDSDFGRRFIRWYYKNGPLIADFIRKSLVLRAIAFTLVVLPAFVFTYPLIFKLRAKSKNHSKKSE